MSSADNQQGSPLKEVYKWNDFYDPSETTRRAPILAFLKGALDGYFHKGNQSFRYSQKNREWLVTI